MTMDDRMKDTEKWKMARERAPLPHDARARMDQLSRAKEEWKKPDNCSDRNVNSGDK